MFARRTDLPLDKDPLGKFLPWLIAFMVYLAALALSGVMVLASISERWDTGMSATLTVQIPPAEKPEDDARRLRAALNILADVPQVISASHISERNVLRLLEPWLGSVADGDLPLPQLIDVQLKDDGGIETDALARRLAIAVPGVTVDDHRVWLERFLGLLRTIEALALAVLGFIIAATVGTVVFATRTGLTIHREAIEVLHLTGARDAYVAAQFAGRALTLGLKGGLIGLALALPTLWGLEALARQMQAVEGSGMIPELSLSALHWVVLALLPVFVAGIAMISARRTVMRNLARML